MFPDESLANPDAFYSHHDGLPSRHFISDDRM
jgi:hypothetical protein